MAKGKAPSRKGEEESAEQGSSSSGSAIGSNYREQERPPLVFEDQGVRVSGERLSLKLAKFASSPSLTSKRIVVERRAKGLPVFDFGIGEAKGGIAPYLAAAGERAFQEGRSGYYDPAGLAELRDAILSWLDLESDYKRENIVVSVGAKQALYNIFLAICDPGDVVLLDAAPWVSYLPMIRCANVTPIAVQPAAGVHRNLRVAVPDLTKQIEKYPRARAFVLNSPCNPTAQVYQAEELAELVELCAEREIFFILDRLYWRSIYDGKSFPTPPINERTKPWLIQVDGLSKNWRSLGGLRVGWCVAPLDLATAMASIQSHITSGTATTSQHVALCALTTEYDHEMCRDLQRKRDLFLSKAREIPHISFFPTEGGFYSFWNVSALFGKRTPKGNLLENSSDVEQYLLNEAGVVTVRGSAFEQEGYLRLCFHVPEDEIRQGLESARRAVEALS